MSDFVSFDLHATYSLLCSRQSSLAIERLIFNKAWVYIMITHPNQATREDKKGRKFHDIIKHSWRHRLTGSTQVTSE